MIRQRSHADLAARRAHRANRARTLVEAGLRTPQGPKGRRKRLGRREEPRRSSRLSDATYLAWIHTLTCAASGMHGHVCEGPIEADHVGPRGLGQKCDDRATIALCMLAHRQRHDHCGPFRSMSRAEVRVWLDEQLAITADAYARHTAGAAGIEAM